MTYCVALRLRDGLVMLSDTRTNAGVDNIATFSKMRVVEVPGQRMIALMTSGNLAVTQAVVNHVTEGFKRPSSGKVESLVTAPDMFHAAEVVGEAVREVFGSHGATMEAQNIKFEASILLGGQIAGGPMRLFEVYAAGNFIEASEDTPFLQIGEHKYGKPILDRAVSYDMPLYDAIKLVLVSMDSTLRSNLTVGLPIDLLVYKKDEFKTDVRRRIGEGDPYFRHIREDWSTALREAYLRMPRPDWAK
jgi:putative proteasome-type protease